MIKKYTLMALQKAINHALSLDESRADKIKALHGKVLEIIITPLNAFFFILFKDGAFLLEPDYEGSPDTIIHSSPLGLIRLSLLPASKVRSLFNDKIKMSGDIELGQQVKQLFDELDIDWEGHLAHFTGDIIAHQIGSALREGLTITQQMTASVRRNITEYVQEEVRLSPPLEEIQDFFNDVDELSLKTERLEAHINQLMVEYEPS